MTGFKQFLFEIPDIIRDEPVLMIYALAIAVTTSISVYTLMATTLHL